MLVVDDNATNRKILEEMLNAWGFCPTSAAGGAEALAALKAAAAAGAAFQLAVLDMMMPGMDGIELALRHKGRTKTFPGSPSSCSLRWTERGNRTPAGRPASPCAS